MIIYEDASLARCIRVTHFLYVSPVHWSVPTILFHASCFSFLSALFRINVYFTNGLPIHLFSEISTANSGVE
jgi:hypothetical protein